MGKGPSADGTTLTEEPREEIREEIAQARYELGETVAALAEKADVKAQAKYKVDAKKASLGQKREALVGKARQVSPETAASAASSIAQKARQNPIVIGSIAAFGVGFLFGRSQRSA